MNGNCPKLAECPTINLLNGDNDFVYKVFSLFLNPLDSLLSMDNQVNSSFSNLPILLF